MSPVALFHPYPRYVVAHAQTLNSLPESTDSFRQWCSRSSLPPEPLVHSERALVCSPALFPPSSIALLLLCRLLSGRNRESTARFLFPFFPLILSAVCRRPRPFPRHGDIGLFAGRSWRTDRFYRSFPCLSQKLPFRVQSVLYTTAAPKANALIHFSLPPLKRNRSAMA